MYYNPEQVAKDILLQHWDNSLPVNPVIIANRLGINVVYGKVMELSGYFDAENQTIYIDENDSLTKQRFTIAHEIGHAVLNHGSSPRTKITYTQDNYYFKEFQANLFAAELLMPLNILNYMVRETKLTIPEMASNFSVSLQALEIRLKRLGYAI